MKKHLSLWYMYGVILAGVAILTSPTLPPSGAWMTGMVARAAFFAGVIVFVKFVLQKTGRM